jgi:thiol-disulfide isomerase/thioredoxin
VTPLRRTLLGAIVGLAAAAGGAATWRWLASSPPVSPEPVAELLGLRLPDVDGVAQSFSQWRGRVLVVNFWATWCAPCREETPVFVRLQARHGPQGLQFVGIAIDDPAKVAAFSREFAVNYPQLIGAIDTVELSRRLGNRAGVLPYTLVVDRAGRIATTLSGRVREEALTALVTPLLGA